MKKDINDFKAEIPLIRKVVPSLIASDLVGVQPMGEIEDPIEKLLREEFGGLSIEEIKEILKRERPEKFI